MTWKQLFTSSIGKKILMALTGVFLIIYLIVHAALNALIFYNDDGATFNAGASFMLHNYVIRFLEVGSRDFCCGNKTGEQEKLVMQNKIFHGK